MNILPEDIAQRIWRNKQYWFHGLPEIRLLGKPGEFGQFVFDFGDEVVKIGVRIPATGRAKLLDAAHLAVHNFEKLIYDKHPDLFKD